MLLCCFMLHPYPISHTPLYEDYLLQLIGKQQAWPTPGGIKVDHEGPVSALDGNLQLLCSHLLYLHEAEGA